MSGAFRIFSERSIALMLTFASIFSSIYVKKCQGFSEKNNNNSGNNGIYTRVKLLTVVDLE